MAEQLIPTRMELMRIKEKIKLAHKGHGLLKKKRDALIIELFKILKRAKDMRKELNEKLKIAYKMLYSIISEISEPEIIAYSSGIKFDYSLSTQPKNVMGVKLMLFNFNVNSIKRPKHLNPIIDETSKLYVEILEYIVKTAEIENAVKKLLKEIERTKRRVNALEYNIIPELEREKKIIIQKLEELERDAFSSLKTIKNKISKSD